jgi:hypothetical protein
MLDGGVGAVSLDALRPNMAGGADLGGCAVCVGWGPPWGWWPYPKCWACIRCLGNHFVGCIQNYESQVSQSPSTKVGINHPRVGFKRLPSGVD